MFSLKKLLPNKKIAIVCVGTEKVKTAIIEQNENNIKLLALSEKRQDTKDFSAWEISNLEWICKTIDIALAKAYKLAPVTIWEAILNVPSSYIIWEINKINYARKQENTKINLEELSQIIETVEHFSLKKAQNNMEKKLWYQLNDTKLIISSISQFIIDNNKIKNPIWATWKDITVYLQNIFTPVSKYNNIKYIWKYIWKNINYTIPKEFSLPKIIEKSSLSGENITILDVWYSKTRIIIQKSSKIIWFRIIDIWISDLIKLIKKDTKENEIEIKNNLNSERYFSQKREFLNVWWLALSISIKELIADSYLPEKVFITWYNNLDFINSFLKSSKFSAIVKIWKKISFINNKIEKELENIFEKNNLLAEKINIKDIDYSLISLILAYNETINPEQDNVSKVLKNVLNKIRL